MNYNYIKKLITDIKQENNQYVSLPMLEMQINMLFMMGKITEEQKNELLEILHSPVEEELVEEQTPIEE